MSDTAALLSKYGTAVHSTGNSCFENSQELSLKFMLYFLQVTLKFKRMYVLSLIALFLSPQINEHP